MAVVEEVRTVLKLTVRDFCPLIGCSRQTYYTWIKRGQVARVTRKRVRNRLLSLARIAEDHHLPGGSKEKAAAMAGWLAR